MERRIFYVVSQIGIFMQKKKQIDSKITSCWQFVFIKLQKNAHLAVHWCEGF